MWDKAKLWLSVLPLIVVNSFISISAQATSADAITLESISAVSTTVLTGENIVMQLEVAVPTGYSWDPVNGIDGGQLPLTALICPTLNWNGTRCTSGSQSLVANEESNTNLITSGNQKTFQIKRVSTLGEFKLYKLVVPQPSALEDVHTYNKGFAFALDSWGDPTSISVPTFLNGDVSVVASLPSPTPTPTPTPTPSLRETSSSNSTTTAVVVTPSLQPFGIQASGQSIKKAPNANGDLTWQRSKEIVILDKNWVSEKHSKASKGSYISTSVNDSKLNIVTRGDAFTLRYMTGKKMGKIQIFVDGKKLAVINTSTSSTKSKAKSWIGIGPGKHNIEIIPILDPGQSIGIDAYQVARAF